MLKPMLGEAWHAMGSNKLRTALTMLGMVIGVGSVVLMMAIDITVYHIFCIHNPQKLSQVRKDRYERAVEWMKAVADEDISIEGAPLLPEEQRAGRSDFRIQSNRKRTNHW